MSVSVASLGSNGLLATSASAPRSPSSSVCSFVGSVSSENLQNSNKYLMKTLCLAKKSTSLPGKADYANLLTSGLGKVISLFFLASF